MKDSRVASVESTRTSVVRLTVPRPGEAAETETYLGVETLRVFHLLRGFALYLGLSPSSELLSPSSDAGYELEISLRRRVSPPTR